MNIPGRKHIRHFCCMVIGIMFLFISATGCSSAGGPQAPQQIIVLMSKYYQIAEHQSYDDIFDGSMIIGNLTINGLECLNPQGNIPVLRTRCEGSLYDADQTRGVVSSYTIESYTLIDSYDTKADVNVRRNGRDYQEHFQFFKDGQNWVFSVIKV